MDRIVECVANYSEGRNKISIQKIVESINTIPSVWVLHYDMGYDANRTVITFAGNPTSLLKAALLSIKVAIELIDMNKHTGEHPCFGAVDVVPLIPIKGCTVSDCVTWSKQLAEQVALTLNLPVYLYAESASRPWFISLAKVRKGGFKALTTRMLEEKQRADYGLSSPHPTAGAVAIGARKIMAAWNINLNTKDEAIAKAIAKQIRAAREQGDPDFKGVKALGWYMEAFGKAQVTTNIMNVEDTSLVQVFDRIKSMAEAFGTQVSGSELIGLLPEQCIIEAGANIVDANDKRTSLEKGIAYLGFNDVRPFKAEEQVLEVCLRAKGIAI